MNRVRKLAIRLGLAGAVVLTGAGGYWLKTEPPRSEPPAPEEPTVNAIGRVDADPGIARLGPSRPGRVAEVPAYEGQSVEAGAVLVRLDDAAARARLAEAEAALAAAEWDLELAEQLPARHAAEVKAQAAAVDAARARLAVAERAAEDAQRQRALGIADRRGERNAGDRSAAEAAGLRGEEARLAALQAADPAPQVSRAKSAVEVRRAQVGQAREELRLLELRAPCSGTVLRVQTRVGEVVDGRPVIEFCPAGRWIVRVDLEPEAAAGVRPGDVVYLAADDASGRTATGRVRRLADWVAPRRQQAHDALPFDGRPTLECVVDSGGELPFRLNETVRVRIAVGD